MIYKPSVAKYKFNLDSGVETSRQLATSPGREIVSILLTAGGTSAACRISDTKDGTAGVISSESILIAANAGESTPYTPSQPVPFTKGLFIEMEQGAPSAECLITYN